MVKRVVRVLSNFLVYALIILLFFASYSFFMTQSDNDTYPTLFGYSMLNVLTGSMEPEIEPGDLIFVKTTDHRDLEVNDVISYVNEQQTVVTHRMIEIVPHEGDVLFRTKGDANNMIDEGYVAPEQILGKMSFTIPNGGHVIDFIKSPAGIGVLVGLIVFILTLSVARKFMSNEENKEAS